MATNDWLGYTEIVIGFCLRKKLKPDVVDPEAVHPSYSKVIGELLKGKTREDIVASCGYSSVRDSIEASEAVNGDVTPLSWVELMKQSAGRFVTGSLLQDMAKALQNGEDVDIAKLMAAVNKIDTGYQSMTPLVDVKPEKNSWIETGYGPLDNNTGGVPKAGLTIIAASPGIGKTTLGLKLLSSMVRRYPKKYGALFTLEMLMSQISARYLDLEKKLTKDEKSRILMSETAFSPTEIYAVASQTAALHDLSVIVIDFADLMVEGEQSEAIMGKIYRQMAVLAKRLKVPVILICQLNRATYTGGQPKINHIRYSGLAEAMSSLILLLYNPNNILADFQKDAKLVPVPGRGYILVGKARFGFRKGGPGAIAVEWDGEAGWGTKDYGYTFLDNV